jgi:hypothetical protein
MTDEAIPPDAGGAAPAGPDRPKGLPPRGPRPPRPGGARPPAPPPGPSAASLRLRAHLMIGILVSCVVLGGLIAWKIWRITHPPESKSIDVADQFEKAMDLGKGASKDIFAIQTKVWGAKNEELKPEDFAKIKAKLADLRQCEDKLKELLELLRSRKLEDTGDYVAIIPKWLQVKLWILDATDLLDNQKPPEYGGLNIPMYLTVNKIKKLQEELKELEITKNDIIGRKDAAEMEKVRKRIKEIQAGFSEAGVKLQALDDYVKTGLTRPDLSPKEIDELNTLRDETNRTGMAIKQARELSSTFRE